MWKQTQIKSFKHRTSVTGVPENYERDYSVYPLWFVFCFRNGHPNKDSRHEIEEVQKGRAVNTVLGVYWQTMMSHWSSFFGRKLLLIYNSKLYICTMNDSRTVGMPKFHVCKISILSSVGPLQHTRGWQLLWWGCDVWCFTILQAIHCGNGKLPNLCYTKMYCHFKLMVFSYWLAICCLATLMMTVKTVQSQQRHLWWLSKQHLVVTLIVLPFCSMWQINVTGNALQ